MTNVEGAKFPLYLTAEEWAEVMDALITVLVLSYITKKYRTIDSVYGKLRDQLEKRKPKPEPTVNWKKPWAGL